MAFLMKSFETEPFVKIFFKEYFILKKLASTIQDILSFLQKRFVKFPSSED
jgi:hypothetical protein